MPFDLFMTVGLLMTLLVVAYFVWRYTEQRDRRAAIAALPPEPVVPTGRVLHALRHSE